MSPFTHVNAAKHNELADLVAAFLANGGAITVVAKPKRKRRTR